MFCIAVAMEVRARVLNLFNVIQYLGAHQLNAGTNFLFSNPHEYVFAGDRGLSLSTGLNKVGTKDTEISSVPWAFSPTLGLILTGFGIVGHQWWTKSLDRTK